MKDEYVFARTMTASVRILPSQATDFREEGYTVFTADVKAAFLKAHTKDGDVVYAKPHHPSGSLEHWIPARV